MKVLLTTFNCSYIHKNLALRWLYVTKPEEVEVELVEYTIKDNIENVITMIKANNYDVIALSVYIWNVEQTKQLIAMIDELKIECQIILGGPEVSYDNDEYFDLGVDAIMIGEGELEFWKYLTTGDNTYFKEAAKQIKPYKKEDPKLLEQYPSPYTIPKELTDYQNKYLYFETSRGCPFKCSYCLSSLDNKIRYFSLEYIEDVFEQLKKYPIAQVKFLDRTFNANKKRTEDIYQLMAKYPNVDSIQVEIVADRLDGPLIDLVSKTSKRYRYEVGIQSFNQQTLASIDRSQDNDYLCEVLTKLIENDVVIHADLIAGLPYEDLASFRDSFNQLAVLYPAELQLGFLKLLKGTKMREFAINNNYIFDNKAPYQVISTPWLSHDDLDVIHLVENGLNRSSNRSWLINTIKYLQKLYDDSLFDLYYDFGKLLKPFALKYQKYDFFKAIYDFYQDKVNQFELMTVLSFDYYLNEKQKPKLLFRDDLSKEQLKKINLRLLQQGYFNQIEVYKYMKIFKDYINEGYILVLFNKQQQPAELYQIDAEVNTCQKRLSL